MAKRPEYLFKSPGDGSSFERPGFNRWGYVIVGAIILAATGLLIYYW